MALSRDSDGCPPSSAGLGSLYPSSASDAVQGLASSRLTRLQATWTCQCYVRRLAAAWLRGGHQSPEEGVASSGATVGKEVGLGPTQDSALSPNAAGDSQAGWGGGLYPHPHRCPYSSCGPTGLRTGPAVTACFCSLPPGCSGWSVNQGVLGPAAERQEPCPQPSLSPRCPVGTLAPSESTSPAAPREQAARGPDLHILPREGRLSSRFVVLSHPLLLSDMFTAEKAGDACEIGRSTLASTQLPGAARNAARTSGVATTRTAGPPGRAEHRRGRKHSPASREVI